MNVHVSYKAPKSPELEREIQLQTEKLQRRLRLFRPELVHLRGLVEEKNHAVGFRLSLNLRLPTGQLAAQANNGNAISATKAAFGELSRQLNKHRETLRSGRFHAPRALKHRDDAAEAFEQTSASVHAALATDHDIHAWVDHELARLTRYVEHELIYRTANGQMERDAVTCDEVVDEVIAVALGAEEPRPERASLEKWLFRLAIQSLRRLAADSLEAPSSVHLEQSARAQNVTASDDAYLQYHQPDDAQLEEDIIADTRVATPEQNASSDEMVGLVERALLSASARDREAFVLFGIEGFSLDEIASITDRPLPDVTASIHRAQQHLQRRLHLANPYAQKILEHTRVTIAMVQARSISA
jgi:RNA polymerase sigma factor (sigma-70 family)